MHNKVTGTGFHRQRKGCWNHSPTTKHSVAAPVCLAIAHGRKLQRGFSRSRHTTLDGDCNPRGLQQASADVTGQVTLA